MLDKKPIIIDMTELEKHFQPYSPSCMNVTVNANGRSIGINITAKEVYIFFYAKAKGYIDSLISKKGEITFNKSMLDIIAEFQIEPSIKPIDFNNWILKIATDAYDTVRGGLNNYQSDALAPL